MSGFVALNVEPEDDKAEEVDDTREIQLEEALKLYQNALKLHSLGPAYFEQAATVYKDLFASDVFRYPEAISEFTREELDDHGIEEAPVLDQNLSQLSAVPAANAQASPSSLPQLIYLSFKNYGQFLLEEYAHTSLRDGSQTDSEQWQSDHGLLFVCLKALKQFAEALERDDTDLDLWRKAARVAQVCFSIRIVRFCLESVLVGDDEGVNEMVEVLGLDEALASGQLRQVIEALQDDLSIAQNAGNEPRTDLLKLLKKTINPFSFLPSGSSAPVSCEGESKSLSYRPKRWVIRATVRSWHGLGQALLQSLNDEQQFISDPGPAAGLYLEVPADPDPIECDAGTNGRPLGQPNLSNADSKPADSATVVESQPDMEMTDNATDTLIEDGNSSTNHQKPIHTDGDPPSLEVVASPSITKDTPILADVVCEGEKLDGEEEATLPNRKRSAGSAGHDEPPDNGRVKSKRLRNRESNIEAMLQEEDAANISARYYEDQLQDLTAADQALFGTVAHFLSKLGVHGQGSLENLREEIDRASHVGDRSEQDIPADAISMNDIRSAIMSWSDEKANSIMYGYGSSIFGGGKAGLTLFLEHSKTSIPKPDKIPPFESNKSLTELICRCNDGWYGHHHVALEWLETLVRPTIRSDSAAVPVDLEPSSYTNTLWPETLKLTVVQLIVREDEHIYQTMQKRFDDLADRLLSTDQPGAAKYNIEDVAEADMAQTLYELHLDIYSRITNPSSQVDSATRISQLDRLQRWSDLASAFINVYADHADDVSVQQWHVIRFIWTATIHSNMMDNISQEHIQLCLTDLQNLLSHAGKPVIVLPNNAALPEISISAVEQEISRINTLDFFMSVFNDDSSDPVSVIESLEPILEPCEPVEHTSEEHEYSPSSLAQTQQLIEFLECGDVSLKLFLWRRLRDAYVAIDYSPKIVSCHLRSIEAICTELSSQRHLSCSSHTRQLALLKWIKELDDNIAKLLTKALADPTAFEVIDEAHLRTSMTTIARLSRILHSVALYEDAVRVGQLPEPKGKNASGTKSLDKFRDKLRDMYVRVSTLQYVLLKEGILQNTDQFESPADDRAEYLRSLHNSLGLRGYCKHFNKVFLKLLKSELMTMDTEGDYSAEMAQVLFDLHQLKFVTGVGDVNHDCPPEPLDKKSAAHILSTVLQQAQKMNIKDLLKSELKSTIDKIQQALGPPKSTSALSYSRRTINAYLKSPINQLQLFRASRGEGGLAVRQIESDSAKVAAYGWYFLLGRLALAKFKSIKRISPGPTEDLDIAITFFKQDLEHEVENWESWFRLAQVYDAKIEEDLLWTADKVNNHRTELATLQRNAIHCYEMAMAIGVRNADDTIETANKMSEMYTCFATRLYASSREPLSMDVFDNSYHQRHYSSSTEQSNLYQGASAPSMPIFSVWRFSAHLLRRALAEKPRNWINHYMLGKCLWKMLTNPDPGSRRRVQVEEVLDAFSDAIENLPERKDSRADHILEPHFKLVSVVHKLVHRKMLTPVQGSEALQATHWARNVHLAEEEDSWEPYVLEILRKIGHADKSNWHHRIIARAAHVIYDDQQNITGALGAKHEFTQQIFTKTMTLQVWKPEFERAGRHFVYTSRYVLFFVSLLNQLNDRASLDQLVRRIRRKPGEYLNHQQVWEQVITSYAGLLRRMAKVPNGYEEALFRSMDHDEFVANAEKLETHAQDPEISNLTLDILRDAIELKKLNNSLMKGTLIDDLIVDCYASLYQSYVATLPPKVKDEPSGGTESKAILHESNQDDGNRERMKLGSILTAQADGNAELICLAPTLPMAPSGILAPPKPTRPKSVTRREVQRKAEALLIRPPPIKTPTLLKHTTFSRPSVAAEVPPPSNKHVRSSPTTDQQPPTIGLGLGPVQGSRVANLLRDDADDGDVRSADSSHPGSVHDSADDESELSELEVDNTLEDDAEHDDREDPPQKSTFKPAVLFPGLVEKGGEVQNDEESSVVISDSESARNEQPDGMDVDEKVGDENNDEDTIAVAGDDTMKE